MARQVKAIYENGVLKPLEPLELHEQQQVVITVSDAQGGGIEDCLDTEFIRQIAADAKEPPGLDTVRKALSKIKGPLSAEIAASRRER